MKDAKLLQEEINALFEGTETWTEFHHWVQCPHCTWWVQVITVLDDCPVCGKALASSAGREVRIR